MSYTKTNWETGDTITAEKLNNLENGVAGNVFVIGEETVDLTTKILNKTWKEILTAMSNGSLCMILETDTNYARADFLQIAFMDDEDPQNITYSVSTIDHFAYSTDSENGYPISDGK